MSFEEFRCLEKFAVSNCQIDKKHLTYSLYGTHLVQLVELSLAHSIITWELGI